MDDFSEASHQDRIVAPIYECTLKVSGSLLVARPSVTEVSHLAAIAHLCLKDADREKMIVILFDGNNKLIGINFAGIGTLICVPGEPREVFKPALLSNAYSIAVAHNHVTGDVTPSGGDRLHSRMLSLSGEILGIPLLDFLIVTPDGRYFSMHEERWGTEKNRISSQLNTHADSLEKAWRSSKAEIENSCEGAAVRRNHSPGWLPSA